MDLIVALERFAANVDHFADLLTKPRPRTEVKPLRVHHYDEGLRTTVSRTVGHRFRCSCGKVGKVRRTPREAHADARAHEAGHE